MFAHLLRSTFAIKGRLQEVETRVLDHLEIQTDQIDKTQHFYAAVLAPLGYEMMRAGKGVGFGERGRLDFFIVRGAPSANVHFAFAAPSRLMVD